MTKTHSYKRFTATLAGAFRGKTIASLLVIELLLAQFAIASPQLHDWMHGVDDCHHQTEHASEDNGESQERDNHVCTIGLLSEGLVHETNTCEVQSSGIYTDQASEPTFVPNGPAIVRHSARSPPLS